MTPSHLRSRHAVNPDASPGISTESLENNGGEGGIRTPGTRKGTSDFESGAFNRALPPLRLVRDSQYAGSLNQQIPESNPRDTEELWLPLV